VPKNVLGSNHFLLGVILGADVIERPFFLLFFLLRLGVPQAILLTWYYGYPELWILRYPAQRYHAGIRTHDTLVESHDVLTILPYYLDLSGQVQPIQQIKWINTNEKCVPV
jgi:hypothetical protein